MPSNVGHVDLGRYRLDRLLGAGGMGEVYLAHDLTLRREVAIKFLAASGSDPERLKRRLIHEAQAVAALDHPSICPVHDVGVDPTGRPFMVMQYVEGETLAARTARGPLPAREALAICAQIADALASAHRRGIIHRDLKPQNVMITAAGAPKLLDFGIAKVLPPPEPTAASAETVTSLADSQPLAGTPAYMSPEQVLRLPLDGRSDLFSLGCILYESLTGHRAFHGQQTVDVLSQILHVHPPAPSTLRHELDERHDELCRRLLAKEAVDRFQSADELVGALRVLQPDTSRQTTQETVAIRRRWLPDARLRRVALALASVLAIAATGFSVWRISRPTLPVPSPDAKRYYDRGADALREGAFNSAATALGEAVRLFPNYPVAHARLAEAQAGMGEDGAAAQTLVLVSKLVPDLARLPRDERLRLDAIRSTVLADADAAVTAYKELADRNRGEPGVWVDLGRAQEAAAKLTDASGSFQKAIAIDPQYATAYLRLGLIESSQARHDAALKAFAEAERIYRAMSNKEGETEVFIGRGTLFDNVGKFDLARTELLRALTTATAMANPFQIVRAKMRLSVITLAQGQFADAEKLASEALQSALGSGLDSAAADGLIDLALVFASQHDADQAETQLRKAIALAHQRASGRIEARALSQLAAVQLTQGRPAEAVKTVQPALDFFRQHKYRTLELTALSIAARGYQQIDDFAKARELGTLALNEAEATGDNNQLSLALTNLAGHATALGSLPEALAARERAEAIHRQQQDASQLPYDLTNRAELLIRLGRFDEAETALRGVDEGAAKKLNPYVGRARRVAFLRALSAVIAQRFDTAVNLLSAIPPDASSDSTSVLAPAMAGYVAAKRGATIAPGTAPSAATVAPALARDRDYWVAAAALARHDNDTAFSVATAVLAEATKIGNDELAWRCAAMASAAARPLGRAKDHQSHRAIAAAALGRLRAAWGQSALSYDSRPDLVELRKAADL